MSFCNNILDIINFGDMGKYIKNINYSDMLYKVGNTLAILVVMYITIKIGNGIITKFVERQKKVKYTIDIKKAQTLGAVLKSILRYLVYFFGIITILTEFFGNISLTFAGIGGVAIGFGSQSLIKDIINGVFILFEDQFAVGDYVEIEGKSGIIESVELRVTKIRDFNGDLHIMPNGLITKVTNHSRGSSRVLVEIHLPYDENADKAIEVLDKICEEFRLKNEEMVEGPSVVGITEFKENYYTIKIAGKAESLTHWDNENRLRMEVKRALDRKKIKMACPKIQIIKENENGMEL